MCMLGELLLMKGNEAVAEAAIRAGCRHFFGYPITPQNELPEYMARRLPEVGGVFVQAESEVAAINMVYGAAGAGARVMTSSSSPGISLKQEGISYLAASELPCLIVNMMRGGPGLGGIQPAQSDYFQATKGGGHGDYHLIVFGPESVQEMVDLTPLAFDLADRYRNPAMILGDGILGQMMEPVELSEMLDVQLPPKEWATTGRSGGRRHVVSSLYLDSSELEKLNKRLQDKYLEIMRTEQRWESLDVEGAEVVLVAYGTTARVVKSAMNLAREEGIRVGLIRPITLWPFPTKAFESLEDVGRFLVVEMSSGQMVEDVRLVVNGRWPVSFYGRTGGVVPDPKDILARIRELARGGGTR